VGMSIITWLRTSDVVRRAEKTFVQAFVAQALVVRGADAKTVAVSGLAAGLSAVWNAYVAPWLDNAKAQRAARKAVGLSK
jgi:hypothetical protein